MFAMRGLAVSFSIFAIVYVALSVTVLGLWRQVWRHSRRGTARSCADRLFILRVTPLVAAAAVTLGFAVPSFLLLEPRAVNEPLGAMPAVLGLCGAALILAGAGRAAVALLRLSRAIMRWSSQARVISSPAGFGDSVCVMRISAPAPPLTAAGILRPRVWLSAAAEFVLTDRELRSALCHEVAHLRRRDNLRKLLLCLAAFPGMSELESAWRETTEMAADDAAVSNASEALDLAAAVIKLSRMAPLDAPAELTTALVHSPAECVNTRVERLIRWTEERQSSPQTSSLRYALFATLATLVTLVVTYSQLLVRVHAATEWLVR